MNHKKNSSTPRIYIDRDCNWFQDGMPILHKRTYLYNNKLLQQDEQGRFFIDEGRGKVYVQVEDAPFIIKDIEKQNEDIYITLNDESTEVLSYENLFINEHNIPYTKVRNGMFNARFSRPAYYRLAELLVNKGNKYFLLAGDKEYFIKQIKD